MSPGADGPFRVGFVAGVTPDKWARAWAERMPRRRLELVALEGRDGAAMLRSGDLHMSFLRLPVDREGLHLIPLYDEQPVVVVPVDHPVAAYDEVDVGDLRDEHLLQDPDDVPSWRDVATEVADGSRHPVPAMGLRASVERVAADAGILVLPLSLARLHRRRDVTQVRVTGVPTTKVALAWPVDADDDRVETFVGIVRGRTANSSRTPGSRRRRPGPGLTSRRAADDPR
jgi:DNA-binding transcriptional LysR family regulator